MLKSKPIRVILPIIFWTAVWWAAAAAVSAELLLPTPYAVIKCFFELIVTTDFWSTTALTIIRIFCGAALGALLGVILSVITCNVSLADVILSPAIRVIRTVPVASFIILVLLWVKKGFVPALISGLMVMPIMWESVSAGIKGCDKKLLEAARAYGMSAPRTLQYVYLPAVKPHLISGVCSSVGLAWKSGVAAEVLCLPKSAVGTEIYYSKIYLETPSLFAWTITVILCSLLIEKLLLVLFRGKTGGDG
ncbi:MAG: ABC transporter permease subunit [Firmicutes bacterium]|nr:ABC transporter permease subunit [Bacillota bacterium]